MTLSGALTMTATGTSTSSPQSKGLGIAGGVSFASATVVTELASDTRAFIGEDGELTATSIDFSVYGVRAQAHVIDALVAAQSRGVSVRGVVDSEDAACSAFAYPDTATLIDALAFASSRTSLT